MNPGVSNTKSTGFGQNQRDVGVKYQQGVVRGRDGLVLLRGRGEGEGECLHYGNVVTMLLI